MLKARHHGNDKYSPLVSGAPYATLGKISEWMSKGKAGSDGFNQKDHYGHKDPLGNIFHVDMKTKTLTCDFSKLSECNFTFPKTTFNHVDTDHNRSQGTFEDGSPGQIQGMPGGGGSSASTHAAQFNAGSGSTTHVPGDITYNTQGQHQNNVQKAVTETFKSTHDSNVTGAVTFNHQDNHTHSVGQSYTRSAGKDTTVSGGQSRSDSYSLAWSASAKNTAWAWLTSRNILGG
jgi:hypothetical protein